MAAMSLRRAVLPGLLAAAFVAAVSHSASLSVGPRLGARGTTHRIEWGRWAYSFDAAFRVERLFDREADPGEMEDFHAREPVRTTWMRRVLLAKLGAADLEAVPRQGEEAVKALQALGYLVGPNPPR